MLRLSLITLLFLLFAVPAAAAPPSFEDAFSPDNGATQLVIKTIEGAKHNIRVAAYSFTSRPIAHALVGAYRRGVDVKIVMDASNRNERYSALTYLEGAGVPTRTNDHYAIMHDKFIVIDNSTLELGSFNFTNSAEERNAENILVIKNIPAIAADYDHEWQRIWNEGAYAEDNEKHRHYAGNY